MHAFLSCQFERGVHSGKVFDGCCTLYKPLDEALRINFTLLLLHGQRKVDMCLELSLPEAQQFVQELWLKSLVIVQLHHSLQEL